MAPSTGAAVIARALHELGVTVIFGLVGIPVVDIAEEAINLGIRFIAFRNEQACSYAATAYGYITGRPGVCLLVGGPGVLHGMAGIGNASANAFPALFLAGSSETNLVTKGAFQEMDAISFLTPHTKSTVRPASSDPSAITDAIYEAYRICWYGRPGPTFVDLPADLIMNPTPPAVPSRPRALVPAPPTPHAAPSLITAAASLIRQATSPLIILGKGCAYARAESVVRTLVQRHGLPFLPTPMGKGVVPDSSPLNTSAARSTALKEADVILILGARLNWILHFGAPPKFSAGVQFIQVDISAEELSRTNGTGEPALAIHADIGTVASDLDAALAAWTYQPAPGPHSYLSRLRSAAATNTGQSDELAHTPTPAGGMLTFQRAFHIIKTTLHALSPPAHGDIVYVSEGANTMDISRTAFPLEHPRRRLDAGTQATMGVGMGYAIAAYAAYNLPPAAAGPPKKIVALEGDSAFGFSAMEIETMARHRMPILIFVLNNSGVYHGDAADRPAWEALQRATTTTTTTSTSTSTSIPPERGLRSTSLLFETRYDLLATMVGGRGFVVRTDAELAHATRAGWREPHAPVVVNVVIDPGVRSRIAFGWQQQQPQGKEGHTEARPSRL